MRNYFQSRKNNKEHLTNAHLTRLKVRYTTQDNCLLGFFHFITFMLPYFFATKPCQNYSYITSQRIERFYLNRETDHVITTSAKY